MPWIRPHRSLPLIALALAAGCGDNGTNPKDRQLTLEIRAGSVPAEEETLPVGGQVKLSTVVEEATGKEVAPQPRARWTSTASEVATVDAEGLVTARQTGTALIIATVSSLSDTVRVNVASPVTSAVACTESDPRVRLAPGQVFTTTGDKAVTLCVEGNGAAGANAEFVMIPFNASSVAESRLTLDITGLEVRTATGPPSPYRAVGAESAIAAPTRDHGRHEWMRERSSAALEDRLRAGAGLAPAASSLARIPALGNLMQLNVETKSTDGCSNPDQRTGRVVAISERAIVVADTANPRSGDVLTSEDFRHFALTFDTLVWRVNTANFGEPTDIDENKRVMIFFTRAVNELTAAESRSYVAGFFFNRDLFRKTGQNACAGSNAAEMFYMMVPDPRGEINRNPRSREFVRTTTVGVLAHEFQHLINDSRRLYVNKAPVWEETWLNEGLSHIAEELVFYATAGIGPGRNIGPAELGDRRIADAYNRYNADNVERYIDFLERPQEETVIGADNLPTRGAAWSFLRYAADRLPGDDARVWKELVGSKTQGLLNLQRVLGVNPRDWLQDWTVAVYTDDAGLDVEQRFQMPSWNFRALIPTLRNSIGMPLYTRYPLTTLRLSNGTPRQLPLKGGSTAYLRFAVSSGQTAPIRTLVGGLPAPSRLRVSVVRTR